tara:strand:+ start:235 stop:684 length:450 start_codon:yes stop_codon:yes gene_type:complete
MIKNNIIILSIIFFLANCGFSPIYLKNQNMDFSIEKVIYTGDRDLNNFLKSNLNNYKNKESNNKFFIEAKSEYKKVVLSKNAASEVTNYQLEANVIFLIKPINKKISITEKKIMESMDDKFEEARYERTIKQNFAYSISDKLSSELIIN